MIPGKWLGWVCIAALFGSLSGCARGSSRDPGPSADPQLSFNAQTLSPAGKVLLQNLIQSGNLPELRWPNFSEYRNDVTEFYESYDYSLPWLKGMGPSPQAQAAIAVLQGADDKGLSAEDYDGSRWIGRLEKVKPFTSQPAESEAIRFDLALTVSLMRYISDVHTGRIDPRQFGIEANIARRKYNLPEFLGEHVVDASDVANALSHAEPPYPGYQRTIEALQKYRKLARENTGQPFPTVAKTVAPGQIYAGVPSLARFLQLVGDLPAGVSIPAGETRYQGALVGAVKKFQEQHGLTPNGRIDAHTMEELSVPLKRRVRQIQLTLERWRWLPPEYAESAIIVNIPEFQLRAYDRNFRVMMAMKVVVGKAYDHNTPLFMSNLQSVFFRPYWEVPLSIVQEEIVPAMERDPEYLAKQNMNLVNKAGDTVAANLTPDVIAQVEDGRLSVRQGPGPSSALGLIKFDFPNEYSVYMHDTPERPLFSQSKRDFSHGCIRLENAPELAAWVLRDNPGWDLDRIRAAMNGDATFEVKLAHPIPVLIVYGTVVVLEDKVVRFYDDLYGQDAELEEALEQNCPYPH